MPPKMPVSVPVCSVEEIELFLQIQRERCEHSVVRKPLENFGDIGNPEWPFKSG